MARRRRGRRKTKRVYARDERGRFAPTGTTKTQRKRRRRVAVGSTVVVAGAVAASQTRSASRARTAAQRRRIVNGHVARAAADHERLASIRARAFPTTALTGRKFDAQAARAEGRKLTTGYRRQAKRLRRARTRAKRR